MSRSLSHVTKEDVQMPNEYLKRCPASLVTREMQIKATVSYHHTPIRMAKTTIDKTHAGEDVEKLGLLYVLGRHIKCYSHSGYLSGNFVQS